MNDGCKPPPVTIFINWFFKQRTEKGNKYFKAVSVGGVPLNCVQVEFDAQRRKSEKNTMVSRTLNSIFSKG